MPSAKCNAIRQDFAHMRELQRTIKALRKTCEVLRKENAGLKQKMRDQRKLYREAAQQAKEWRARLQ